MKENTSKPANYYICEMENHELKLFELDIALEDILSTEPTTSQFMCDDGTHTIVFSNKEHIMSVVDQIDNPEIRSILIEAAKSKEKYDDNLKKYLEILDEIKLSKR